MRNLIAKLRESYLEALRLHSRRERVVEWLRWDDWDRRWLFALDVQRGCTFIVPPDGGGEFVLSGHDADGAMVIGVVGPADAFAEALAIVSRDGAEAASRDGDHIVYNWPLTSAGQVGGGRPPGPHGGPGDEARDLARMLIDTVVAFRR